jgi:hypothetical protein
MRGASRVLTGWKTCKKENLVPFYFLKLQTYPWYLFNWQEYFWKSSDYNKMCIFFKGQLHFASSKAETEMEKVKQGGGTLLQSSQFYTYSRDRPGF